MSFRKRSVELLTQGDLVPLVADGVMDLRAMRRVGLSRERLYAALRAEQLLHLGEVERVYMETSGSFSVYRRARPTAGLEIVPPTHPHLREEADVLACETCGNLQPREAVAADGGRLACPHCHQRNWHRAVRDDRSTD